MSEAHIHSFLKVIVNKFILRTSERLSGFVYIPGIKVEVLSESNFHNNNNNNKMDGPIILSPDVTVLVLRGV